MDLDPEKIKSYKNKDHSNCIYQSFSGNFSVVLYRGAFKTSTMARCSKKDAPLRYVSITSVVSKVRNYSFKISF